MDHTREGRSGQCSMIFGHAIWWPFMAIKWASETAQLCLEKSPENVLGVFYGLSTWQNRDELLIFVSI